MIADFGLATHVHEKKYLYCRCGTPGYVAPEIINIEDMSLTYSSVCDVYSVGLIFYLLYFFFLQLIFFVEKPIIKNKKINW